MRKLHVQPEHPLEHAEIGGADKAFFLYSEGSEINDLRFDAARDYLVDAMSDLPAFNERMERQEASLSAFGISPEEQGISLVLDNEYEPLPDEDEAAMEPGLLAVDWAAMADRVDLDPIQVKEPTYAGRLDAATNISDDLRRALKDAYDL